jgi:hypothetical protein
MTIIPVINKPDTALKLKDGRYYAAYHVQAPGQALKRRLKYLRTTDIAEARVRRDEFFAGLLGKRGSRLSARGRRPKGGAA